jgi:hypothetical protein
MSASWIDPDAKADAHGITYVTEISVPRFGDDGVQRLYARMKQEPSEADTPEPEAS